MQRTTCRAEEAKPSADPFAGYRWVDLSHAYDAETIFWPTGEAFQHIQTAWGETEKRLLLLLLRHRLERALGHAPGRAHPLRRRQAYRGSASARAACRAGRRSSTSPPKAGADPDYLVTPADIEADEAENGAIEAGAVVLFRTGWSRRWPNVKEYMGDDRPGRTDDLHFPRPCAGDRRAARRARDPCRRDRHGESRPRALDRLS